MHSKSGFTIVELLITVVVIAILAAISIVAYNGIQSRAHNTAIRSDFRHVKAKMEEYKLYNGRYPSDPNGTLTSCLLTSSNQIRPQLEQIDMQLSHGSYNTSTANTNLLYLASNDGESYALLGYAIGNPTYYITNQLSSPEIYSGDGTSQKSEYPGGSPCGIAENLGISTDSVDADFEYYYIFNRNSGGFRVW